MNDDHLLERETTAAIIGAFYEVYNRLGFGFLEHVYSLALERELIERGHTVKREVVVSIYYKGKPLTKARLDMVVDDKVVVETSRRLYSQHGVNPSHSPNPLPGVQVSA